MRGERVLVTGGAGLTGSNMAEALAEENDVIILDDLSTGKLENIKDHEKKARNGEEIRVVDDMVMSPTYTRDAAEMIRDILMKELPSGIYHVENSGYCSWFDFAKGIFALMPTCCRYNQCSSNKSKKTHVLGACECQARRVWV